MEIKEKQVRGLTEAEVLNARIKFGSNEQHYKKPNRLLVIIGSLIKEPMVVLLLATSILYFISGKYSDSIFLGCAIIIVSVISIYQESRSHHALEKLKSLTRPFAKVIRNYQTIELATEELVHGDLMIIEEGNLIPADGKIIQSNDFSVNEAILTGEAYSVYKDGSENKKEIFQGTTVMSGLAIAEVTAIGTSTKLGAIGRSLESIEEGKTPLEQQIRSFVKKMVLAGSVIFVLVWLINFLKSHDFAESLLKALTLAMSVLPEEIPVAFTSFMALGAWRLMKMGVVVKQMKTVETLGSATVICTDKTGTITQNSMELVRLYTPGSTTTTFSGNTIKESEKKLINDAMWASEPIPFDPMEISLHKAYTNHFEKDERSSFQMIHEYPLSGTPPMMTHLFEDAEATRIIAAKGAPEAILPLCDLPAAELKQANNAIRQLASEGYRVLGVATANFNGNDFPEHQTGFKFHFSGMVAFEDPPKLNMPEVLQQFYTAGIKVKIITGDNAFTTRTIARQIGLTGYEKSISGEELLNLSDTELQQKVEANYVFTRMFPEAKLRVINAMKQSSEVVAMTGDGVNDGPALKAAHIGIAMGTGSETAKEAAAMVIADNDLQKIADAVAMGRRIYTNLKKAVQYIISIHIPIILIVLLPLAMGWLYPSIFSPVHIIFFELIMGPTCSIIFENEPMEKNAMSMAPRPFSGTFFNWPELTTSIIQGLMITTGLLFIYQFAVANQLAENATRTMVFLTLITANIFLTLVNRSFYYSMIATLRNKNHLMPQIIIATVLLTVILLVIVPLRDFFQLSEIPLSMTLASIVIGSFSVTWFELWKWYLRAKN